MSKGATQIAGVFVPLTEDEQASVWKLLASAGLSQDGRGIREILLSKKLNARPSTPLDRAFGFLEKNPQILQEAGDVARVILGGRGPRPRRRFPS